MCCLFGMIDCGHSFTGKQRTRIVHALAASAEARGTDASGIAYNSGGKLHVYKWPLPGHQLPLRIPNDAAVIMGHTRDNSGRWETQLQQPSVSGKHRPGDICSGPQRCPPQ